MFSMIDGKSLSKEGACEDYYGNHFIKKNTLIMKQLSGKLMEKLEKGNIKMKWKQIKKTNVEKIIEKNIIPSVSIFVSLLEELLANQLVLGQKSIGYN